MQDPKRRCTRDSTHAIPAEKRNSDSSNSHSIAKARSCGLERPVKVLQAKCNPFLPAITCYAGHCPPSRQGCILCYLLQVVRLIVRQQLKIQQESMQVCGLRISQTRRKKEETRQHQSVRHPAKSNRYLCEENTQ